MKIIVYCIGDIVHYKRIEREVHGGPNCSEETRVEVSYEFPSKSYIKYGLPDDANITVYFEHPQKRPVHYIHTLRPIFKILVESSAIRNIDDKSGTVPLNQVFNIISSDNFDGDQNCGGKYTDFSDSKKTYYYRLCFNQPILTANQIATLCTYYISGIMPHHVSAANQLRNLANDPSTSFNQLFSFCLNAADSFLRFEKKHGDYIAMLTVILEAFQTDTALKLLSSEEKIKMALFQAKYYVYRTLREYQSSWKMTVFGHRHEPRVKAIMKAVLNCDNINDLVTLIQNQRSLFNSELPRSSSNLLADKWTAENRLKHKKMGGLFASLTHALKFAIQDTAPGHLNADLLPPTTHSTLARRQR